MKTCFRPLPGSFLFHPVVGKWDDGNDKSFRPLPGSFLFHQYYGHDVVQKGLVSVPCRGLFYFINNGLMIISMLRGGFRPLPGSFLFHRNKTKI